MITTTWSYVAGGPEINPHGADDAAGVVTCNGEDCAVWFPDESTASTVYVYVVDGATLVSEYVVCVPGTIASGELRSLRYTVKLLAVPASLQARSTRDVRTRVVWR